MFLYEICIFVFHFHIETIALNDNIEHITEVIIIRYKYSVSIFYWNYS